MTTIAEVRQKYPQYEDLSDEQLATALHKKFYSDLSFDDFSKRIGLQAGAPVRPYDPFNDAPRLPGEAGFDDPNIRPLKDAYITFGKRASEYGSNVNRAAGAVNRAEGNPVIGGIETLGTLGSGFLATPVGAVVGAVKGKTPEEEARIAEDFVRNRTYSPRTEQGKAQLGMLGALASPLSEIGADIALLPLAGQRFRVAPSAPAVKPPVVPSTMELKAAKNAAYKRATDAGVSVKPESFAKLTADIASDLQSKHLNETLHPGARAALQELAATAEKGAPLTLEEVDQLRQIVRDAPSTKADRRLTTAMVKRLDSYLDNLTEADVTTGNAAEGVSALKEARSLNRRLANSEMVDELLRRAGVNATAKFTQAGEEHALRQEFKRIALRKDFTQKYTPAEQVAITKVAEGGAFENAMRDLGKFDPTSGGMSSLLGAATGATAGGSAGFMMGGPTGAGIGAAAMGLALPPAGFVGRRLATSATKRNVGRARETLVGRGLPPTPEEFGASLREAGILREPTSQATSFPKAGLLAAERSAEEIRAELQRIDAMTAVLDPSDPRRQALAPEAARLRRELEETESRDAEP